MHATCNTHTYIHTHTHTHRVENAYRDVSEQSSKKESSEGTCQDGPKI